MGLWEVFRQQTLVIYSSVIIYKFGSVHYVFASITEKVKSIMKSQSNKSKTHADSRQFNQTQLTWNKSTHVAS